MKLLLIILVCQGKFCSYEPIYAVRFETEEKCQAEAAKYDNGKSGTHAYCVVEVKK